jgi:hypothetical protein
VTVLNRAFSSRNVQADPEEAKAVSGVIVTRAIKCKPTAAGPDDMAQVPFAVGKTAD